MFLTRDFRALDSVILCVEQKGRASTTRLLPQTSEAVGFTDRKTSETAPCVAHISKLPSQKMPTITHYGGEKQ